VEFWLSTFITLLKEDTENVVHLPSLYRIVDLLSKIDPIPSGNASRSRGNSRIADRPSKDEESVGFTSSSSSSSSTSPSSGSSSLVSVGDASVEEVAPHAHHHEEDENGVVVMEFKLQKDEHAALVYTQNLIEAKIVRFYAQNLRNDALRLDNVVASFQFENATSDLFLANMDNIQSHSEWKELFPAFLLVLMYFKLQFGDLESARMIYTTMMQIKKHAAYHLFGRYSNAIADMVDSIIERRLRFEMIQYETESTASLRRTVMAYNELFECAQLDYITKQRIYEELAHKGKHLTFEDEKKKRTPNLSTRGVLRTGGAFLGKERYYSSGKS